MVEFRTSGSGIGTDVYVWGGCDFEALEFSGRTGAGIPHIHCEQPKVLGEVMWGWADSMEKELQVSDCMCTDQPQWSLRFMKQVG